MTIQPADLPRKVNQLADDVFEIYDMLKGLHGTQEAHGVRLDRIDDHLEAVVDRLDGVDGRLEGVDRRLEGVDRQLEGVDRQLEGMDGRFDGVEAKLDLLLAGRGPDTPTL